MPSKDVPLLRHAILCIALSLLNDKHQCFGENMVSVNGKLPHEPLISNAAGMMQNLEFKEENTTDCYNILNMIGTEALEKGTPWALAILDSAGKLGSGLLKGATTNLGNLQECLSTKIPPESGIPSKLKFCQASLKYYGEGDEGTGATIPIPPGFTISQGVCVPQICSDEELANLVNSFVLESGFASYVSGCVSSAEAPQATTTQIVLILLLALFAVLVVLGTLLDVKKRCSHHAKAESTYSEKQSRAHGSLLAFSIVANTESLLDTRQRKGAITCMNGIRFLSMTWVVLCHSFNELFWAPTSLSNHWHIYEMVSAWPMVVITNGSVSVDTFFTMSGLLVSYLLLKELSGNGGRFKVIEYYVHRYIRLTPIYAMMICAYIAIYPLLGRSHLFLMTFTPDAMTFACKKWWSHLLYINNMVSSEGYCFPQAWYLANDMQLYIVAPLLVLPLVQLRKEISRQMYLLFWMIALPASTAVFLVGNNKAGVMSPATLIGMAPGGFPDVYDHVWFRLGPYIVGIYAGYLLHIWRDQRPKIPGWLVTTLWLLAAVTNLAVVYGLTEYFTLNNGDITSAKVVPLGVDRWYTALHRTAWGMGVAWVILACHWGYGGFVNSLLSWRGLVPLAKLTYACYLIHPYVQLVRIWNARSLLHVDSAMLTFDFLAYLVITYMLSYVASMMFEFPVLKLEKVWLFPRNLKRAELEETANNKAGGSNEIK